MTSLRHSSLIMIALLVLICVPVFSGCPGFKPESEGEGEAIEGEGSIFEGEPEECTYCNRVVVWMPKRLSAAGGEVLLPISVSSAEEISPSGIDVIVEYDPAFIDPASITVEPTAITGQMSFTANTATPGVVRIMAVGQQGLALRGDGHLFDVRGTLLASSEAPCSEVIFDRVSFYTADIERIPTEASDAGEVCIDGAGMGLGDMNADGYVDSADVLTALRVAVGRDVGRDEDSLAQVGDFNGDNMLDSADAVMLQRYAMALPVNPAAYTAETGVDPMLLSTALADTEQVSLTVSNEYAAVGESAFVTITASTAYALSGFDFVLSYPADSLEVVNVARGSVVSDANFEWVAEKGELRISLGRERGVTGKAIYTTLATVRFNVVSAPEDDEPLPLRLAGEPALKGQYGDSFGWYTRVMKVNGSVTVLESEGEGQGETAEGEGQTLEGEGEGEMIEGEAPEGEGQMAEGEIPAGPQATVAVNVDSGSAPLTVQFTDQSTSGSQPITQWSWTFGDGGTSTQAHPSHTYVDPGIYSVILVVTTSVGSDTSASYTITVTGTTTEGEGEGAGTEGEGQVAEGEGQASEGEGQTAEGEGQAAEGEGEPSPGDVTRVMLPGDVPLEMVWIPAGTFLMGRYSGEQDSYSDEDPQHQVTISSGFWMGKYELTQAQWTAVMGTTPWSGQSYVLDDPDSPAVYVSWNDAQSFISALNTLTGKTFRLPTEAEWEYACRAGTTERFYWGDDSAYSVGDAYCWWTYNAWDVNERYAHVVGLKLPNAWGLYDMSGNVREWCNDWYGTYPSGSVTDPEGPSSGSYRVLRGGCWGSIGTYCRSAYRSNTYPSYTISDIGFRLSR